MLGVYDNFPTKVHKIVNFTASTSIKGVQKIITQSFHRLNRETFGLEDVAHPSIPQCTVILELGVAKANTFNYLDQEEKLRVLNMIRKKTLTVMDFFCALRYYKMQDDHKTPLNFDYYMLRFIFDRKPAEIQVFHESGPRHVSPQEIVNFFVSKINQASPEKKLTTSFTS